MHNEEVPAFLKPHLVEKVAMKASTSPGTPCTMGRMKKDSNGMVRWMMVQAARSASQTDPRMRRLYELVASRRGDGKVVVKVANKMATIIWHMLTKRKPYQQVKEELYRSKVKRMARIAG